MKKAIDLTNYLILILKGTGMGIANVIPGVSGGTIALITGIFERLITALKSLNLKAIQLFFTGKFKEFAIHVDLYFLVTVFAGIGIAIISIARLFEYLFAYYPVYIWSYFFGLILASVWFVGKSIQKWNTGVIAIFAMGAALAIVLSLLKPAVENNTPWYLFVCGIVAICSMILPGVSGSFVLVLMGNYQLVMIEAVNNLDLRILIPVALGAVFGLIAFSHFLSWVLKKYHDLTISVLTGFILGSLGIIWPWKNTYYVIDKFGQQVLKDGIPLVSHYRIKLPDRLDTEVIIALLIMISGFATIWIIETLAKTKKTKAL